MSKTPVDYDVVGLTEAIKMLTEVQKRLEPLNMHTEYGQLVVIKDLLESLRSKMKKKIELETDMPKLGVIYKKLAAIYCTGMEELAYDISRIEEILHNFQRSFLLSCPTYSKNEEKRLENIVFDKIMENWSN